MPAPRSGPSAVLVEGAEATGVAHLAASRRGDDHHEAPDGACNPDGQPGGSEATSIDVVAAQGGRTFEDHRLARGDHAAALHERESIGAGREAGRAGALADWRVDGCELALVVVPACRPDGHRAGPVEQPHVGLVGFEAHRARTFPWAGRLRGAAGEAGRTGRRRAIAMRCRARWSPRRCGRWGGRRGGGWFGRGRAGADAPMR